MNRAAATVCGILLASAVVVAQGVFATNYTKGLEAFRNANYAEAEQLFLASLHSPDTPSTRGPRVSLGSQQRGFCPESYLALIYREERHYADVLRYVDQGIACQKNWEDDLVSAKNAAKRAVGDAAAGLERNPRRPVQDSIETDIGPMFALVIGINDYGDSSGLQRLSTPVADARQMSKVLHDDFGFDARLLLNDNATRKKIVEALDSYKDIPENSSLLIYYAGHGEYVKTTDKAAWLPSDADSSATPNWIWSDDLLNSLKAIRARHILVVSDSCYSGAMLTRSARPNVPTTGYERYVEKAESGISRNLMSSGSKQPVSDSGGGGHSVFAAALLKGLRDLDKPDFTGQDLFQNHVSVAVAEAEQSPVYTPILPLIADQGADFVFHRRSR
jgi:hypothetical protein